MVASSVLFKHAACRAHLGADEQHVGRRILMKSAAALSHRVNVQPVADYVTSAGLLCVGRSDAAACMAAVSAAGSAVRVHWNACHC